MKRIAKLLAVCRKNFIKFFYVESQSLIIIDLDSEFDTKIVVGTLEEINFKYMIENRTVIIDLEEQDEGDN